MKLLIALLAPIVMLSGCASLNGPHAGHDMHGQMHDVSGQTGDCPMMGHSDDQRAQNDATHAGRAMNCPMASGQTPPAPSPPASPPAAAPDPHGH